MFWAFLTQWADYTLTINKNILHQQLKSPVSPASCGALLPSVNFMTDMIVCLPTLYSAKLPQHCSQQLATCNIVCGLFKINLCDKTEGWFHYIFIVLMGQSSDLLRKGHVHDGFFWMIDAIITCFVKPIMYIFCLGCVTEVWIQFCVFFSTQLPIPIVLQLLWLLTLLLACAEE